MIPRYVIIADRITAAQREQMHAIVKEHSDRWWHAFANAWIVTGKSAGEWRDLVGPVLPTGPASVLVLRIDTEQPATWAFRGVAKESARAWIRKNLARQSN